MRDSRASCESENRRAAPGMQGALDGFAKPEAMQRCMWFRRNAKFLACRSIDLSAEALAKAEADLLKCRSAFFVLAGRFLRFIREKPA